MFLAVMNPHDKSVSIIAINRNAMALVDVYDEDGVYMGQYTKQITLQHGYGDGMELSCERSVAAVSRLFYNLPISGYAAINMGAIPALNDAVGGVQVTVLDDVIYPEYDMDLHQGDVLTHIVIPGKDYQGYHGFYIKYSMRNAMDIATISCSVVSKVDQQAGVIEDVRITFGVAAPVPYRCTKAEEALKGLKIEESLYEKTAQLVREEINPRDSWRASRVFRLQIGGEIAARALRRTVELAGGDRI